MNKFKKNISTNKQAAAGKDRFIRFLSGSMTDKEKEAFERDIANDPFAKEALEGFQSMPDPKKAVPIINAIHKNIEQKSGHTTDTTKTTPIYRIFLAAAVLLLMIGGGVYIVEITSSLSKDHLSMETSSASEDDEKKNEHTYIEHTDSLEGGVVSSQGKSPSEDGLENGNIRYKSVDDDEISTPEDDIANADQIHFISSNGDEEENTPPPPPPLEVEVAFNDVMLEEEPAIENIEIDFLETEDAPDEAEEKKQVESEDKTFQDNRAFLSGNVYSPEVIEKDSELVLIETNEETGLHLDSTFELSEDVDENSSVVIATSKLQTVEGTASTMNWDGSQPQENDETAYYEGLGYYVQSDYDSALDRFRQVLPENANYANAHYYSGLSYYKKKKNKKALAHLDTAIQENTTFMNEAKWLKAIIHLEQDEISSARPLLEELIHSNSRYADTATILLEKY